jgi:hypothetical protein
MGMGADDEWEDGPPGLGFGNETLLRQDLHEAGEFSTGGRVHDDCPSRSLVIDGKEEDLRVAISDVQEEVDEAI